MPDEKNDADKALTKPSEGTAKGLEAIGKTVHEAYKDALQPAARPLGQALAVPFEIMRTVLRPIQAVFRGANDVVERLEERLRERLKDVAPEKIVEPAPSIAGPALLGYAFVQDEEPLRAMFEELLAKAMVSDTRSEVHPSFVEVIKQLSSFDAGVIEQITTRYPARAVPVVRIHVHSEKTMTQGFALGPRISILSATIESFGVEQVEQTFDNLTRLGLLEWLQNATPNAPTDFATIRQSAVFLQYEQMYTAHERVISAQNEGLRVTLFGENFIRACVPKRTPEPG